ncbi:hypothetical protein GYN67_05540 [Lactococcus piscium]|uniref:hypothetical protein n=1 Tax=Pseudolactococcus carnosus TaxID=2749961 RepID=UPI001FBB3AF0|nr:hypothetical protein [Lactococcus carnosus]MCJ1996145.1 hypothetical protein [Lactococcus carnosus]
MERIIPIEKEKISKLNEEFVMSDFSLEKSILKGKRYSITIDYYGRITFINYYGEDVFQRRLHKLETMAIEQGVNWEHNIFQIENSCLIEKIHEDNMRYFEQIRVPLYHYFIRTDNNNDIVELVLTDSPDITIEKIEE